MYKRIKFRSQYPSTWEDDDSQFVIAKSRFEKTVHLLDDLDAAQRPVILMNIRYLLAGKLARRQLEMWTVHVMEQAVQRLQDVSQNETKGILLLISLKGTSLGNYDVVYLKWLFEAIFRGYTGRFTQVLIYKAPAGFTQAWKLVKPILGFYSVLVKFVNKTDLKTYIPFIHHIPL